MPKEDYQHLHDGFSSKGAPYVAKIEEAYVALMLVKEMQNERRKECKDWE